MRKFLLGLSIVMILAAGALALRDNSAHVSSPALAATQATTASGPTVAAVQPTTASSSAVNVPSRPTASSDQAMAQKPAAVSPSLANIYFVPTGNGYAAFEADSGRRRFDLPAGLFSADRTRYYAVKINGNTTSVARQNLQVGGSTGPSFSIDGQWTLGAVSASGRWLALRAVSAGAGQTRLTVMDANDGSVRQTFVLYGNFDIDALAPDGSGLYLIEHRPDQGPASYSVRLYNLTERQLVPDAIREKGETEVMSGKPGSRVASPDGRWILTLYMKTDKHEVFIHTLDMSNATAVCIFLPAGSGDPNVLLRYSLVLSPDGQTVYATNPTLGVAAVVTLDNFEVARTVTFTPHSRMVSAPPDSYRVDGSSVVSPDGARVYFTDGENVWALDAGAGEVTGPVPASQPIVGLVPGTGPNRLYAVTTAEDSTLPIEVQADGSLRDLSTPLPSLAAAKNNCPLTTPVIIPSDQLPRDGWSDPFPTQAWYRSADGKLIADSSAMKVGGNKFGWLRPAGARLQVSGVRLDGPSPAMHAWIPSGYPGAFQVSDLEFPTGGCWTIDARVDQTEVRFTIWVDGPREFRAAPGECKDLKQAVHSSRGIIVGSVEASNTDTRGYTWHTIAVGPVWRDPYGGNGGFTGIELLQNPYEPMLRKGVMYLLFVQGDPYQLVCAQQTLAEITGGQLVPLAGQGAFWSGETAQEAEHEVRTLLQTP